MVWSKAIDAQNVKYYEVETTNSIMARYHSKRVAIQKSKSGRSQGSIYLRLRVHACLWKFYLLFDVCHISYLLLYYLTIEQFFNTNFWILIAHGTIYLTTFNLFSFPPAIVFIWHFVHTRYPDFNSDTWFLRSLKCCCAIWIGAVFFENCIICLEIPARLRH